MAKRLTRYILLALVLGIIAGWAINAAIDDGTPASAARLKDIAEYLSIVTALFLRLIKMIIAPLVFSTLVAGIAHMGDIAALGRVGATGGRLVHLREPRVADARPDPREPAPAGRWPEPPDSARNGGERRRNAGFNLKEFVTHLVPASVFEAMSKNEILPDRRFLLVLRRGAHRHRRQRAGRSSEGSRRSSA